MSQAGTGFGEGQLARRLGTRDALVVGLSAMIGAGVFAAFPPAARAAGSGLLLALAIAAIVATCNAMASAQLAQSYPSSGGTYLFGRAVLGPWWGFTAGWGFIVGKTASCAAMALTFAHYALPSGAWPARLLAVFAVLVMTWLNLRGVTRTAYTARVLLAVTAVVLLGFLILTTTGDPIPAPGPLTEPGALGILQGAGLLFFAFAGYARIATLGEEVRNPASITRAILIAFIKPFKDLIASIPNPVMGGICVILFGFIAANGLRVLVDAKVDFGQTRNTIIASVMLVLGLGGAAIQLTKLQSLSGMALAALAGIILNLILPEKKANKADPALTLIPEGGEFEEAEKMTEFLEKGEKKKK